MLAIAELVTPGSDRPRRPARRRQSDAGGRAARR